jgi:hypothetical protein
MALEPANSPGRAGCRFITGIESGRDVERLEGVEGVEMWEEVEGEEMGTRNEGVRMCIQPAQTIRSGMGIGIGVEVEFAVEFAVEGSDRTSASSAVVEEGGSEVAVVATSVEGAEGFRIILARSASYASLALSISSGNFFLYGTRLWYVVGIFARFARSRP